MLNAKSGQPLYKQLEEIIKRAIDDGVYKQGEQIPTELELSETYNVSRITVRKALKLLTKANYLTRVSGKGTFVSSGKFMRPVSGVVGFSEICESLGRVPGAKTVKTVIEDAGLEDREQLGLGEEAKIVSVERIRYADGIPVSFEISHFPPSYAFLLNENLNDNSLYDILKRKYNIAFTRSSKVIELVYATYELSVYLNIPERHPLICITSINDINGEVVCLAKQLIVGDKIQLIL